MDSTICIVGCKTGRGFKIGRKIRWLCGGSQTGCVLVVRWWTSDRLLEKWSYGWACTGYFVHIVGRLCGRMVGRSDHLIVWLVTDCCSCVGQVRQMGVWFLVVACFFAHSVGRTTKLLGRSQFGRSVGSHIDGRERLRLMRNQISPCG